MPTIYDNQETTILAGLERFLGDAHSLDACVGYFNFQGWKLLEQSAARLSPESGKPAVRLLIVCTPAVSIQPTLNNERVGGANRQL